MSIQYTTNLAGQPIVKFNCPKCNLRLTASLIEAGNVEKCGECGSGFKVPGEARLEVYKAEQLQQKDLKEEKKERKKREAAAEHERTAAKKAAKKKQQKQAELAAMEARVQQASQRPAAQQAAPKRIASPNGASIVIVLMLVITVLWGLSAIANSFSIMLDAETIMQQLAAIGESILAGVLWVSLILGILGLEICRLLYAIASKDVRSNG